MRIHGKSGHRHKHLDTFTVISDVWWDTGMRNLAGEDRRTSIQTTEGRERESRWRRRENLQLKIRHSFYIRHRNMCPRSFQVCVSQVLRGSKYHLLWCLKTQKRKTWSEWFITSIAYNSTKLLFAHSMTSRQHHVNISGLFCFIACLYTHITGAFRYKWCLNISPCLLWNAAVKLPVETKTDIVCVVYVSNGPWTPDCVSF